MSKDFDIWNEKKKQVNDSAHASPFYFYQREIWWCAIGLNVGVETDGKHDQFERPVLIIRRFNKEMFWGVPLTTSDKSNEYYQVITHDGGRAWAIVSQLKTFSTKRLLRKMGTVSHEDFAFICEKVQALITIEPSRVRGFSEAEASNE